MKINKGINFPKKAMILAAGEGTRLRPLTDHKPKCMIQVGGIPVLEHNIGRLRHFGVTELMINLYYMPDAVQDYFEDGSRWDITINYSVEEQILGTAGGLKKAADFFDAPFFVWYGDNMSSIDLRKMHSFHQEKTSAATIALFYREDPTSSGIVGLDQDQRIARFLEKPKLDQVFSHWVSAGIFLLEPIVLDYIPANTFYDFGHDVLPAMLVDGLPMFGYQMAADETLYWIDTPSDLQRVRKLYERRLQKT
jgi:NDP-sugar pyrophosphorylase family protein